MQLCFVYTSNPLDDRDRIDAVLAAIPIECRRQQIADLSPKIDINDSGELTIEIEVDLNSASSIAEPVRIATAAVEVFVELATQFELAWNVGHQHEPCIGTISAAAGVHDLMDEVKIAVDVARSLADFSIDEEENAFVRPETSVTETGADDQASWDELFQPPDTFIRFPEFDEE
ncbi:hypothetical protein Mal15_47710 [Stieleria maiorica]|uniref:Uncharacterized protein n=1 Tax=Stieleria maiorica TaxID=2795974 RepID=A0A5B9MHU4_9BACT|nr:hypothetical protein [Stieleria maiorica]QEG00699.1 hypothetical protein Mal15_47710 [Stieleria maiorica]